MKVILNEDVKYLGEEGDIKNVAVGYARNYLYPRGLAVPCNEATLKYFEKKRAEIEARKELKRKASASLKERLEAEEFVVEVSAGQNGKLYGSVSSLSLVEMLTAKGFEIERKKIEIPGASIKTTGKFPVTIHLYESETATITVEVKAREEEKREEPKVEKKRRNRHADEEKPQEVPAENAEGEAEKPQEEKSAE